MAVRLTGAPVRRVEDGRLLTGSATFLADRAVEGCLHAVFVRSPHAHARIGGIGVDAARSAPGVVAVLTAAELGPVLGPLVPIRQPGLLAPDVPPLATDVVRFVGDPVAVVIAGSQPAAVDAAELVEVLWDPLPALTDAVLATAADAPLLFPELGTNVLHRQEHRVGDPAAAIAGAHLVVHERIRQHRVTNAPMECRGTIAEHDAATGTLRVTTGHQSPHDLRLRLAEALGLAGDRVQVRVGDMGGSFGQKSGLAREDAVVAAAAILLGRPVRWHEDRTENLLVAGQAREERADVTAGFDADGNLLGLQFDLVVDLGAYPQIGYPANGYANLIRSLLPAAYRLEHYGFRAELVATTKATYVPYRGPWEFETFARERVLDIAARRLGLDRAELRRRNLLDAGERSGGSCLGVDLRGVSVDATLDRAVELVAAAGWAEEVAAARARGRHVGWGLACYVEPAPVSPSLLRAMGVVAAARTPQEAQVRVEDDGSVTVVTSQQPHGQGHETTLAQLAADRLGLPLERIRVVSGDTDLVPVNRVGTGGSRAATLASGAVIAAADLARDRLLAAAADRLEIAAADLELAHGRVAPRDAPSRAIGLAELAGIEATGAHLSEDGTWSQATHCAMAEVDAETGAVTILRYLVVEDCGPPINPDIVDGQIRGGVAQGIGAVLFEHAAYAPDGQPRATSLADYLVPGAPEVPPVEIHHLHAGEAGASGGAVPYRGVGEGGAIGSPATVVSAVEDALAAFGVELTEQHLPPTVILRHCGVLPA